MSKASTSRARERKSALSTVAFAGFPKEGLRFLADLERNNDRAWFEQHKALYREKLKAPAERFAAAVGKELEALLDRPVRAKTFRIHRDLRFSKDKQPYSCNVRMAFFDDGPGAAVPRITGDQAPDFGFYLSLEPRTVILGAGSFGFSKALLASYRAALAADPGGSEIAALIDGLVAKGYRLNEPELKRVPTGIDPAHPRAELLRRKSLALWRDLPDHSAVSGSSAVATCVGVFAELLPLHRLILALTSR